MLKLETDNTGKIWFVSEIWTLDYDLLEMGVGQKPDIVPITIDPEKIIRFNPADYKDQEGNLQTYVDLQGGNAITIDCNYDVFKRALYNYKTPSTLKKLIKKFLLWLS